MCECISIVNIAFMCNHTIEHSVCANLWLFLIPNYGCMVNIITRWSTQKLLIDSVINVWQFLTVIQPNVSYLSSSRKQIHGYWPSVFINFIKYNQHKIKDMIGTSSWNSWTDRTHIENIIVFHLRPQGQLAWIGFCACYWKEIYPALCK